MLLLFIHEWALMGTSLDKLRTSGDGGSPGRMAMRPYREMRRGVWKKLYPLHFRTLPDICSRFLLPGLDVRDGRFANRPYGVQFVKRSRALGPTPEGILGTVSSCAMEIW